MVTANCDCDISEARLVQSESLEAVPSEHAPSHMQCPTVQGHHVPASEQLLCDTVIGVMPTLAAALTARLW